MIRYQLTCDLMMWLKTTAKGYDQNPIISLPGSGCRVINGKKKKFILLILIVARSLWAKAAKVYAASDHWWHANSENLNTKMQNKLLTTVIII